MRSLIYFCLFVLALATATTEFEDCGSSGSEVVLDFEGCSTPPCIVKKGSNYAAAISFKATEDETSVTNHVTAKIAGIDTPWPGLDPNGCNNLNDGGTPCPISSGSNYDWVMDVAILKVYPEISTMATIKFLGDDKSPIVCIQIPVTII